jgi:hypothetical protein
MEVEGLRFESDANLALILGIIALVGFHLVAPFAWYVGHRTNRRLRELGRPPNSHATVGMVLGMIFSILLVLAVLAAAGFFLLAILGVVGLSLFA